MKFEAVDWGCYLREDARIITLNTVVTSQCLRRKLAVWSEFTRLAYLSIKTHSFQCLTLPII